MEQEFGPVTINGLGPWQPISADVEVVAHALEPFGAFRARRRGTKGSGRRVHFDVGQVRQNGGRWVPLVDGIEVMCRWEEPINVLHVRAAPGLPRPVGDRSDDERVRPVE